MKKNIFYYEVINLTLVYYEIDDLYNRAFKVSEKEFGSLDSLKAYVKDNNIKIESWKSK